MMRIRRRFFRSSPHASDDTTCDDDEVQGALISERGFPWSPISPILSKNVNSIGFNISPGPKRSVTKKSESICS